MRTWRRDRGGGPSGGATTRRDLLRAAAGGATVWSLAGCGLFEEDEQPAPPPDPLAPFLIATQALASRYELALAAHPELSDRLTPLLAAHRAHASEVSRVIGEPSPTTGASAIPTATIVTGDAKATLTALRAAEQAARQAAATACADAPATRAALLGSISAARATHAEVLR